MKGLFLIALGLIVVASVICSVSANADDDTFDEPWAYDSDTKVLTYTGPALMPDYTEDRNPAILLGAAGATSLQLGNAANIGDYALYGCTALTSVTLSSAVTGIGSHSFEGCIVLSAITGNSVSSVGEECFKGCSQLLSAEFPDLKTIGSGAFTGCISLTAAEYHNVTTAPQGTFSGCISLTSVTMDHLTSVPDSMFSGCVALMTIDLTSAVSLGNNAFDGCTVLKNLDLTYDNIVEIGNYAFRNCISLDGPLSFSNVTSAGNGCFSGCSALGSVALPKATSVGSAAFSGCLAIREVDIPKAESLSDGIFDECGMLVRINADGIGALSRYTLGDCVSLKDVSMNSLVSDLPGLFQDHTELVSVSMKSLKVISEHMFDGCTSLGTESGHLYFDNVESIGDNAFKGCTGMTSIVLPNAESAGYGAFEDCTQLVTVTAARLSEIGKMSFKGCTSLSSASFPLTSVGDKAFEACTSLVTVSFDSLVGVLNCSGMFVSCTNLEEVTMDNVTSVNGNIFEVCPSLRSVSMNSLTDLSDTIFCQRTSLTAVSMDSLTAIKANTFKLCTSLSDISFQNVESIGNDAFSGAIALKNVDFPKLISVGDIFNGVSLLTASFDGATSITPGDCYRTLTSISMNSMTSVPENAFSGCTQLSNISFEKATSIGKNAFNNCNSLEQAALEKVTSIGDSAFEGCGSLTTFTANSVTRIGSDAFRACRALSSVVMDSLITAGDRAFYDCDELKDINFPLLNAVNNTMFGGTTALVSVMLDNLLSLDGNVFAGCITLESVSMSELLSLDAGSFSGCTNLSSISFPKAYLAGTDVFADCPMLKTIDLPSLTNLPVIYSGTTDPTSVSMDTVVELTNDFEKGTMSFSNSNIVSVSFNSLPMIPYEFLKDCRHLENASFESATSVGNFAFVRCTGLTALSLPKVRSLGTYAFEGCTGLATFDAPDATSVPNGCFKGCQSLASFEFGGNSISDDAFNGCSSLTLVSGPNVKSIGRSAFEGCTKLSQVSFDSLTDLDKDSFKDCASLKEIDLPLLKDVKKGYFSGTTSFVTASFNSAKTIDSLIFSGNTSLTSVSLNGLLILPDNAFSGCSLLSQVSLDSVTGTDSLNSNAFKDCPMLKTISMPGLTRLYEDVFTGTTALENVSFGSLTDLGPNVFRKCASLRTAVMNEIQTIPDEAFLGCSNLTSFTASKDQVTVGDRTFKDCVSLSSLTMGGAIAIGNEAFCGCIDLTEISMPELVSSEGRAFYGCTGLKSIEMPKITAVSEEMFGSCTDLHTVIANTAVAINGNAFEGCTSLIAVAGCFNKVETIGEEAFVGTKIITIKFPFAVTIGDSAFKGTDIAAIAPEDLPNLATLGHKAFADCASLRDVTMDNLTSMEDDSFEGCLLANISFNRMESIVIDLDGMASLKSVSYGSVTSLPDDAFSDCTQLRTVSFGSLESVGAGAFSRCGFTEIGSTFFPSLTTIGDGAFSNCSQLTRASMPGDIAFGDDVFDGSPVNTLSLDGITSIADGFFKDNTLLISVSMNSLTEIGSQLFKGCSSLSSCSFSKAESIGEEAFFGCASLREISGTAFGNAESLGDSSFASCSSLTKVSFPKVTSLGTDVFKDTLLNDISFDSIVSVTDYFNGFSVVNASFAGSTSVANNAFTDNRSLAKIILGEIVSVGTEAFKGCASLATVEFASVGALGDDSFKGCVLLTDIDFTGLQTIGDGSFADCTGLSDINIVSTVSLIHTDAFRGCTNLRSVTVDNGNTAYSSSDGVLYNKGQTLLVMCPMAKSDRITITYMVTEIASKAFFGSSLTSITLHDNITTIGSKAFSGTRITSIYFGNETKSIASDSFEGYVFYDGDDEIEDLSTLFGSKFVAEDVSASPLKMVRQADVSFTVKFDLDGGTGMMPLMTVPKDTPITLPVYDGTKEGNDFCGWLHNTIVYPVGSEFTVSDDTVFEANWAPYKTVLRFYGNGSDSGTMENAEAGYGTQYIMPESTFEKQFYRCTSWNTQPDGSGTSYLVGSPYVFSNPDGTELDLYAQWEARTHTVTYFLNGGTNDPQNPSVYAENADDIVLRDPVYVGNGFLGWYLESDFVNKLEKIESGSQTDYVLFAKWGVAMVTATVDIMGGHISETPVGWTRDIEDEDIFTKTVEYGTYPPNLTKDFSIVTKTNYHIKWVYSSEQIVGYSFTAYINWIPDDCIVSVDLDGVFVTPPVGWVIDSFGHYTKGIPYGTQIADAVSDFKDTERTGYTLSWEPSSGTVQRDTSVKAVWTPKDYKAVLITNGGNVENLGGWSEESKGQYSKMIPFDTPAADIISSLGSVTKTGYALNYSYAYISDPHPEGVPDRMTEYGLSITAEWTLNSYMVSVNFNYPGCTYEPPVGWAGGDGFFIKYFPYGTGYAPIIDDIGVPEREGYTVDWTKTPKDYVSEDGLQLTAVWTYTLHPVTVTIDIVGVSVETPEGWTLDGKVYSKDFPLGTPEGAILGEFTIVTSGGTITWDPVNAAVTESGLDIVAVWSPNEFDVKIDINGGEMDTPAGWQRNGDVFTKPYPFGTTVDTILEDFGTPAMRGYVLAWDHDGSDIVDSRGLRLSAIWTAEKYIVTVIANGGQIDTPPGWTFSNDKYTKLFDYGTLSVNIIREFSDMVKPGHGLEWVWTPDTDTLTEEGLRFEAIWTVKNYRVTVNISGGTLVEPESWTPTGDGRLWKNFNYGTTLAEVIDDLGTPTMVGHHVVWQPESGTVTESGLDIVAVWAANRYPVTVDIGAGSIATPSGWQRNGSVFTNDIDYGTEASAIKSIFASVAYEGYTLEWETSADSVGTNGLTMNAVWTRIFRTVTVDLKGFEYGTPSGWTKDEEGIYSKVFEYGTAMGTVLTDFDIERTGYTLAWDSTSDTVTADGMDIEAVWTPKMYSVTVNINGGTIDRTPSGWTNTSGSVYTKLWAYDTPAEDIERDFSSVMRVGFEVRWVPTTEKVTEKGLTIVAYWEAVTFTVRYYNEGKIFATQSVKYGSEITLPDKKDPTKAPTFDTQYTFVGWEGFTPGMKAYGDLRFDAKFESSPRLYELTFLSEGKVYEVIRGTYGSLVTLPEKNPTKAPTVELQFTFLRWDAYTEGQRIDSDKEYNAIYTESARQYLITFNAFGEVFYSSFYEYGNLISKPVNEPSGRDEQYEYTFLYWKGYSEGMRALADYSFDAEFKKTLREYTVRFINNDEVYVKYENIQYGAAIRRPAVDPTKPSTAEFEYEFEKWSGYTDGMTVTGDADFTALYIAKALKYVIEGDEMVMRPGTDNALLSSDIVSKMKGEMESSKASSAKIILREGEIGIDSASLMGLEDSDLMVSLRQMPISEMTEAVKNRIGTRPLYTVSIGDMHEFAGELTVSLAYQPKSSENPSNLIVWHVSDDGTYYKIPCEYSDSKVTFKTSHLSNYAVMYEQKVDPQPSGDGGSMSIPMVIGICVGIVAAFAVAGIVMKKMKKNKVPKQ